MLLEVILKNNIYILLLAIEFQEKWSNHQNLSLLLIWFVGEWNPKYSNNREGKKRL